MLLCILDKNQNKRLFHNIRLLSNGRILSRLSELYTGKFIFTDVGVCVQMEH